MNAMLTVGWMVLGLLISFDNAGVYFLEPVFLLSQAGLGLFAAVVSWSSARSAARALGIAFSLMAGALAAAALFYESRWRSHTDDGGLHWEHVVSVSLIAPTVILFAGGVALLNRARSYPRPVEQDLAR
jgi:hypothetical protein